MRFLNRVAQGKKGSGHGRFAAVRGKPRPHTKPRRHEEKKQNHGRQNHWEESQVGVVIIPPLCLRASVRDSPPAGNLCPSAQFADASDPLLRWPEISLTLLVLHAMHSSMQKIQILFPTPLMGRVRAMASEEDRPVSEVIRRAVERFLDMKSENPIRHRQLPTFRGGKILVSPEHLKEAIYDDESL